jgi:hypothetical protein
LDKERNFNSFVSEIGHDFIAKRGVAPTLDSSLLEWERAITQGHATHPVSKRKVTEGEREKLSKRQ